MKLNLQILVILTMLLMAACGQTGQLLPPTEEQQIENVAIGYFERNPDLPEYEAEIEAVVDDWARVSLSPAGVESSDGPLIIYLQNQDETDNPVPTAQPLESGANQARITNDFGWVVISKPQAQFSDEELDAMGIPEEIRP